MTKREGIPKTIHAGFIALSSSLPQSSFSCRYIYKGLSVHTKAYLWKDSEIAFIGSANYTQSGFLNKTRETVEGSVPKEVAEYYDSLVDDSILCTDPSVPKYIKLTSQSFWRQDSLGTEEQMPTSEQEYGFDTSSFKKITLSLLDRNGEVPSLSGLNWGQRPGRNHNQAYLAIRKKECPPDFFPSHFKHLTILTDDNHSFECNIAQDNGKAIHTTDNAALGLYFRKRISVPSGKMVVRRDLEKYGRTDIDFYKIDDKTYYMVFAKKC